MIRATCPQCRLRVDHYTKDRRCPRCGAETVAERPNSGGCATVGDDFRFVLGNKPPRPCSHCGRESNDDFALLIKRPGYKPFVACMDCVLAALGFVLEAEDGHA